MSSRATDNLQQYIHEARLPTMPFRSPPGELPLPNVSLNIRPERYRKLKVVHTLNDELFSDLILDWVAEFVPYEPLGVEDEDERTGARLTIPCEPFSIAPLLLARAEDIERLYMWLDMFPLETIRRILHLTYKDSNSWKFIVSEEMPSMKTLTWTHATTDQGKEILVKHDLGLFLMPPWVLSTKDLQEFARGQLFPDRSSDIRIDEAKTEFRGQEWLWSKLWDSCVSRACPWFIVTTYTHWVFGVFTAGWTTSFVSPVYTFDSQGPTILELFGFWLMSSVGYPGGFVVPEIPLESKHLKRLWVATPHDISPEQPAEALAVSAF